MTTPKRAEKAMNAILEARSWLQLALVGEHRSSVLQKIRDCQQALEVAKHEVRDLEAMTDPKGEVKRAAQG